MLWQRNIQEVVFYFVQKGIQVNWCCNRRVSNRLGQFPIKCEVVGIFGEKLVNIHF